MKRYYTFGFIIIYTIWLLSFQGADISSIHPYLKIIITFLSILFISIFNYTYFCKNDFIEKYFKKKLNQLMKDSNKQSIINWKDIVGEIETTHHSSIIAKIKDLDSEDTIKIPQYYKESPNDKSIPTYEHKYDFNIRFLHKIREFLILFEMIKEKFNHKEMKTEKTDGYKESIDKKILHLIDIQSKFKLYLNAYHIIYLSIPILITLIISSLIWLTHNNNNYFYFFLGITILLFIIPLMRTINTLLQWKLLFLKKNIIIKSFYFILLAISFTIITIYAISLLNLSSNEFNKIFHFFVSLIFSNEFNIELISQLYFNPPIDNKTIENYLLVIKFITWFTIIGIFYNIINSFFKEYDQFYYEQKIKKYLLPPDLSKIISLFLLTVVSIGYLYMMIVNPPKLINSKAKTSCNYNKTLLKNNNSKEFILNYYILKEIDESKETKKDIDNLKEDMSLRNFLPFSIFLALLGTLLAISTRDIMENYFTGLSMKINSPYEVGDRVKIADYGMLEVREIGTRSDDFYEINTNSIISIPHKKLSQIDIKNYTNPTLDYRDEITIYINDKIIKESSIPRDAEKILLMSAFINTGVKLPKIENIDKCKENKELTKYALFKIKFSLDKYLEYCENNRTNSFCIKNTTDNKKLNKIIKKIWKKLEKKENYDKNMKKDKKDKTLFENLFIKDLVNLITLNNNDKELQLLIKKSIIAIICSVVEYQEIFEKLHIHCDENGIRRKYKIFDKKYKTDLDNFSKILVNISFYYYMLANRLWELKEKQHSLIQKRKIDKAMTQILDVPRVSSSHEFSDGVPYWKVKLLVTLELSEQSDETIHHINMYIHMLWDEFLGDTKK